MQKYYHHSLYVLRNGSYHKLKEIYAKLPPKEIIDTYELRKKEFTKDLNKDILKSLEELDKPKDEKDDKKDKRKLLTNKQKEVLILLAKYNGNIVQLALNSKIKNDIAYFHKRAAAKKGYFWEEFKEKEVIS